MEERARARDTAAPGENVDYDGDISWASLPRLSVGEGVALREGEGESDGPTGVEDLGAAATW